MRGRYQSSLQLSDKDVLNALEAKKADDTGHDRLRLCVAADPVPGAARLAARRCSRRRKEAEALRARFKGCDEGMPLARTMRDVAVRDQVIRSSADLPPELRKVLDSVPLGQLTAPEVTRHGVEMFAICAKQRVEGRYAAKRQAREAMFTKRFEQQSKRYLADAASRRPDRAGRIGAPWLDPPRCDRWR